MKFVGILLVLAIVGYTASVYLETGSKQMAGRDMKTAPKEMIDEAHQNADAISANMMQNAATMDELKNVNKH